VTPDDVRALVVRDYFAMAYLGTLGVLQIAAARSGLSGFWFIPNQAATRALGFALVVAGIAFFSLAPLWTAGPWGSVPGGRVVVGAEGDPVPWGKASYRDLPQARNINDVNGGLSGNSQALWYAAAAGTAIVTTYVAGSLVNVRRSTPAAPVRDGVEALKTSAAHRALAGSLAYWRANWRNELRTLIAESRRARRRAGRSGPGAP
jgi:hypothetical protein